MPDRRQFLRGLGGAGAGLVVSRGQRAQASAVKGVAVDAVDVRGPVLGPLLARNRQRYPGARFGANHMSMAVLALAGLGGTREKILDLGEGKLRGTKPFPDDAGAPMTAGAWRGSLGNLEALPKFRRFFTQEIARRGVAGTLRVYLPELFRGLAATEFHCMIRTAYGVRFDDPDEVAMGLGYWSAAFTPLGPLLAPGRVSDPVACLTDIRGKLVLSDVGVIGRGKSGQLAWVGARPEFPALASTLRISDGSLPLISRAMVRLMAMGGLDVLHTVTGTHAFRVLEPFVTDRQTARRYLWQALVAYYLSEGSPALEDPAVPRHLPPWPEIIAKAVVSGDDHGLKLTFTSWEEDRLYHDDHYRQVAAQRWELL